MNRRVLPLAAVLTAAILLPGAALQGQNPLPNSPPSLVPRNPPLQPAAARGDTARSTSSDTAPASYSAGAASASTSAAPTSVSGDYVLSPSDTLEMNVYNEPTLTTTTRISADGTVQFPLIGEVKLGGLPVREARELVRRRYNADYIVEPQVYLNVTSYAQRRFTVLGQVNRPGTYDFPGGEHLGLLEAVGLAGGFTRLANEGSVLVKRGGSGAGADRTVKVNAKKQTTGDNKPFELAPGDVITVNESWF